jgi:MFS family permease
MAQTPVTRDAARMPAPLAPLQGGALALGTVALSLATFMNVLDTSIANVSIPAIAGDLGVAPDQGTWVITSFAVANAISLPLTGWLTQRYGQVRLFTTSVLLFVLASFLCGFAPSLGLLIVFRVIQGAVAGPMIPLSQALLLSSYPKAKAGSALAAWSITTLVAPVVGPLLGGWITDNIAWPWIFYINVPVGLAAAAVTWFIYQKRETPTARLPVDAVGMGLLVLWVGALQLMLDRGDKVDPRWFATGAFAVLALVLAMRSHFNTDADFATLMVPTIVQGIALAVFFIPLITMALSGLAPSRIPAASGLFNFARITAGSFGTSIATTLWDRRASLHHAQLVEHVTPYDPSSAQAFANLHANGLDTAQSMALMNRLIDQQASMLSANDIFLASAFLFLLLIGVVWLARPLKRGAAADAAAGAH